MSEYKTIKYEQRGAVAIITLNRPEVNNAVNSQMVSELWDAFHRAGEDDSVRAILVTAAGPNFNAGGDLQEFKDATPEFMLKFNGRMIELYKYMMRLRKPIIAAVQGFCVMDMLNGFDLIIAADNARFANPEIGVGISPGAGISQLLVRWVGRMKAKQLLFFPDPISAWEAQKLGIVNWVVPADRLFDEAFRIANQLANGPTKAIGAIKMCINVGGEMPLEEGLLYQLMEQLPLFNTEDQKEGMKAFLEKRKPVFKGK
jgi:enoyl-CoA hydratase/carnithine racemase